MKKRLALVAASVLAGSLWAASVSAEPTQEAAADSARSAGGLSKDQMKAFADLTGDSPYRIAGRLAGDPRLVPLAAKAADTRMSRKSTGLLMTVLGFTILGVGDVAGTVIMVTTPGYPDIKGHEGRFLLGAGIAVGSLAIGLALGIPGIVKMVRTSAEEERALDAYSPTRSDLAARPAVSPGQAPGAPLFGLTF